MINPAADMNDKFKASVADFSKTRSMLSISLLNLFNIEPLGFNPIKMECTTPIEPKCKLKQIEPHFFFHDNQDKKFYTFIYPQKFNKILHKYKV